MQHWMGSGGSLSHFIRQPYKHFHDLMENVKNVFVLKIMPGRSTFFCPAHKSCVKEFLDCLNEKFKKMFVFTEEIELWQHDNIEWGLGDSMNFFVSLSMPCDTMCDTGRLHHQTSSSRKLFLKRFENFLNFFIQKIEQHFFKVIFL